MVPRVLASLITISINVAVAVVLFFAMLITMNGYSESDATYGIGIFLMLAGVILVGLFPASFGAMHLLERRGFGQWTSMALTDLVYAVVGAILLSFSILIGVGVAELARSSF